MKHFSFLLLIHLLRSYSYSYYSLFTRFFFSADSDSDDHAYPLSTKFSPQSSFCNVEVPTPVTFLSSCCVSQFHGFLVRFFLCLVSGDHTDMKYIFAVVDVNITCTFFWRRFCLSFLSERVVVKMNKRRLICTSFFFFTYIIRLIFPRK